VAEITRTERTIETSGFLRSKVARRIFLLFVLCALMPVSLLAVLSLSHVTKQLHRQTLRRLHHECKAAGLTIIERLFFLETDLKMLVSNHQKGKEGPETLLTDEVRKRLGERFQSLVLVNDGYGVHPLLGISPFSLDMTERMTDQERLHIAAGKSLVRIRPKEGGSAELFMIRAVTPARPNGGLLVGEIHSDYLWGGEGFVYPETELFVLDQAGPVLFTTLTEGLPLEPLQQSMQENPASGQFSWGAREGEYLAGYRTLFMLHDFLVSWVLVRSQSKTDILEPIQDFKKIFPLVILLSFLVVLLLSHNQIRRNLVPIAMLRDAAVRFGARDFRSRVRIDTKDEFQLLGSSFNEMAEDLEAHFRVMTTINRIGLALSAEKDTGRLLEIIFQGAKKITAADGGVLYTVNEKKRLELVSMQIDSLGDTKATESVERVPLYDEAGEPNLSMVAAYSVNKGRTISIPDIYNADGFDLSWHMAFDRKTGYRSQSFLSVPLRDHEDEIIGVLQLVNAVDRRTGSIAAFSDEDQRVVETLASQAAVAMTKNKLLEDFKRLFDSLTELIATAIDEKSDYTGDHCRRVPVLAMMLAEAVHRTDEGAYRDLTFSDEELYELRIAALLHDCGKVTTPVHIIDKSKRLETIFDRMSLIDARFEVLKRDAQLAFLRKRMSITKGREEVVPPEGEQDVQNVLLEIEADREFLRSCNDGTGFVSETMQHRVSEIAGKYSWAHGEGEDEPCLTEDEVRNLSIPRGTLTSEERKQIEYHVTATEKMLESLPYPKSLRRVPLIVGTHHERIDGHGYPRGLRGEEIPLQGKILAIADVFEALTAKGRPYKKANTLMEALRILGFMKQDGHIDPELFYVFLREKVYVRFSEEFLEPDQIDEIIFTDIPGYEGPGETPKCKAA
jgi:HD-GYP domain-containing protein (c-di-GMP phosphodiesterase class II)/HAMP domain-containing protein